VLLLIALLAIPTTITITVDRHIQPPQSTEKRVAIIIPMIIFMTIPSPIGDY